MSSVDLDDLAGGLDHLDTERAGGPPRRARTRGAAVGGRHRRRARHRRPAWLVEGGRTRLRAWVGAGDGALVGPRDPRPGAHGGRVRDAPDVHDELAAGRVGVAQVRELGRAHANPRVGPRLIDALPALLEHAQHLPDTAFKCCVRRWEALADVDGAHQGHDAADANRSVHAFIIGDRFHLDATAGVIAGTGIVEVLRRFEQAQFDAEWDDLRARYGEDACPAMLERTAPQRRFDALSAVFNRAAATTPDARPPEPVVNIVVDQLTWEAWVARLSDEQPDACCPTRPTSTHGAATPSTACPSTRPTP